MSWIISGFADEAAESADDQIIAVRDAGLTHIDPRSIDGYNISELPLEHAAALKQKFDTASITVNMLGTPIGKIDIADDFQIDQTKLDHVAKVGQALGCNQVRIFSYYNKNDQSKDAWRNESLSRLTQLKQRAQELGLVLYLENELHLFGDTCEPTLEIISALRDGKTFKTIFDFDNYNQVGEDVWQNWLKLRDVSDAFHLKESDSDCQHVPVGEGAGRIKDILTDAKTRGWTGCLSLEPHLAHSPAVMATGASGQANQRLADLSPAQSFVYAAKVAKSLLEEIDASFT